MVRSHRAAAAIRGFAAAALSVGSAVSLVPSTLLAQQGKSSDSSVSIFAPLDLAPAPSQTRLANGTPGPKYWQNRADYAIRATLDTGIGRLRGSLVLRYTNNSPQTLDVLWLQTEQTGIERAERAIPRDMLDSVSQRTSSGKSVLVTYERPGHPSLTKVVLAEPLKPGKTATLQIDWQFIVPPGGGRMGRDRDRTLYQFAQWFPRMVVYDDVKGWNLDPYVGSGEFYLDYGDYTLDVTVPNNYIIAASGTLQNPSEVLTPVQIARLAVAAKSDTVVRIITSEEIADGSARPSSPTPDGMRTWKFIAKNVRDVAWAGAPNYLWDATQWKGIMAHAFYRQRAAAWKDGAKFVQMSVQEYSERWAPYPYPQMTGAEGPTGGMEYPMITFTASYPNAPLLYNVLSHEIGHQWFPMIVGSNERAHAWMDEGINQFINTFSDARAFPIQGDQAKRAGAYVQGMVRGLQTGQDRVMDIPVDVPGSNVGYQAYFKPAAVMEVLRREVLGAELFDQALRTYITRWAYKHPTPQDFFRTFNDVSKQDLSWFWREFFYEAPGFDQTVDTVKTGANGAVMVTYANKARGVMPIRARLTFADSTTQEVTHTADVWKANPASYTATYKVPGKTVTMVTIDPESRSIDSNRANNTWKAAPKE